MYRISTRIGGQRIVVYCHFGTARILFPKYRNRYPKTTLDIVTKGGKVMASTFTELLDQYAAMIEEGRGYDKRLAKAYAIGYQNEARDRRNLALISPNERTRAKLLGEARACYRVARALMKVH